MGITLDMKENVTDYLANQSPTPPSHLALGDDNTAFTESDTTLANEISRKILDSTNITGNNRQVEYSVAWTTTELVGDTIRELGLFNASTSGTMFNRVVIGDIDKNNTFSLKVIVTIKVV